MKTAEYTADNCQEQTHTRPVADLLPLDRELKVGRRRNKDGAPRGVADSLPLDRELKGKGCELRHAHHWRCRLTPAR